MHGTYMEEYGLAKDPDTDLTFTCRGCPTKVSIGGELGYRSHDAKAQGEQRLCTTCWNKSRGKQEAA